MTRLALAAALLALVAALLALVAGCATGVPSREAPPVTAAAADPVQVTIPSLRVTDEVVPVGLCETKAPPRCEKGIGEMELPEVTETGWYRLGPRPGELGRAILAGHVDWKGTPGAFKQLGALRPGDLIRTTDAAGIEREWRVYDVHQIPKRDYAARAVPLLFDDSRGPELALVTCSGDVSGGEYSDNTIVRARPE